MGRIRAKASRPCQSQRSRALAAEIIVLVIAFPMLGEAPPAQGGESPPTGWRDPLPLSDVVPNGVTEFTAGIDGAGRTLVAYAREFDGVNRVYAGQPGNPSGYPFFSPIAGDAWTAVRAPALGVGAQGNVTVVWLQKVGGQWALWSRFASPVADWGNPRAVPVATSEDVEFASVGTDASGNAIAVFLLHNGSAPDLWASRGNATSGWGAPQRLGTSISLFTTPRISVGRSGAAHVVWVAGDPPQVFALRYDPSTGWGTTAALSTTDAGRFSVAVATNASGAGVAVWSSTYQRPYDVTAARFELGSGWSAGAVVAPDNTNRTRQVDVALDDNGGATAAWSRSAIKGRVFTASMPAGGAWGAPREAGNGDWYVQSLSIAADAGNNATIAWGETDYQNTRLRAATSAALSSWSSPSTLSTTASVDPGTMGVAAGPSGTVLVSWSEGAPLRGEARTARFGFASGWEPPVEVSLDSAAYSAHPGLAANRAGDAVAAWVAGGALHIREYRAGLGWESEARTITPPPGFSIPASEIFGPRSALADSGLGLVIWSHQNETSSTLWAIRKNPGEPWGAPVLLGSAGLLFPLAAAASESGTLIAVALNYSDGNAKLGYTSEGGAPWSAPTTISLPCSSCGMPSKVEVEFGPSGEAWVAFGGAGQGVEVARFLPSFGWDSINVIAALNTTPDPSIDVDSGGNFTILWSDITPTSYSLRLQRFRPDSGWFPQEVVHTGPASSSGLGRLDGDGTGELTVVWTEWVGGGFLGTFYATVLARSFQPSSGWGAVVALAANSSNVRSAPWLCVDDANRALVTWSEGSEVYKGGLYKETQWVYRDLPSAWSAPARVPASPGLASFAQSLACARHGGGMLSVLAGDGSAYVLAAQWFVAKDLWPPALSVSSPSNLTAFGSPLAVVAGITEPGAVVALGGLNLYVAPNGTFSGTVPLSDGANELNITSTDAWGNRAVHRVTVFYFATTADLVAELQQLLSLIGAAQEGVDALFLLTADLTADLASVSANVTANDTRLDAAESTIAQARIRADAEEARLLNATLEIAEAWASLNATIERMDSAETVDAGLLADVDRAATALATAQAALASQQHALNGTQDALDSLSQSVAALRTQQNVAATQQAAAQADAARAAQEQARMASTINSLTAALIIVGAIAAAALGAGLWALRRRPES